MVTLGTGANLSGHGPQVIPLGKGCAAFPLAARFPVDSGLLMPRLPGGRGAELELARVLKPSLGSQRQCTGQKKATAARYAPATAALKYKYRWAPGPPSSRDADREPDRI